MTLNISGSGVGMPLVGNLIERANENVEKIEQAISLPQQNSAVKFSNANNAAFMQQMPAHGKRRSPRSRAG